MIIYAVNVVSLMASVNSVNNLADVLSGNDLAEVMTNYMYNTVQHLPSVVLHVDFNAVWYVKSQALILYTICLSLSNLPRR